MNPQPPTFWAKLGDDAETYHPLLAHSADVAAVMGCLLRNGSPFVRPLNRAGGVVLTASHRRQLVYLAALHDLGKTNHGFQDKRSEPPRRPWPRTGHVKVVVESAHLRTIPGVFGEIFTSLPGSDDAHLEQFYTFICHHGRPWMVSTGQVPNHLESLWQLDPESGRDPATAIRDLVRWAAEWSELKRPEQDELPWKPGFSHLMAGMITLADWIGSTEQWFPFEPEAAEDPRGYWEKAVARAEKACEALGLRRVRSVIEGRGPELLKELFPQVFSRFEPTHLQSSLAEMDLPTPGSRIVIESETGSGKTEAVLALYSRLRAQGLVSGLVFALPTRATSKAMHDRVCRFVDRLYPEQPPVVALAMGGHDPEHHRLSGYATNAQRIHEDDRTRAESTSWATEHHKRFFAAEIVVGTVDQVLLAGLAARHAHLRLALLSRHLVVVDELHSYDRYMAVILENLLSVLGRFGAVTAFLSATLSDGGKRPYAHGRRSGLPWEDAVAASYPSISVSKPGDEGWRTLPGMKGGPVLESGKDVSWTLTGEDEAIARAVQAAESGARVLLLANTVRDAMKLVSRKWEASEEAILWRPVGISWPVPYHSRFSGPDRVVLDEAILASFGRPSAETGGGELLVSTQVVEQSLDVDFDLLVTYLAPVDVLLQRLGRTHRHPERPRPTGFEEAQILVIGPEDGFARYRASMRGRRHGWGTVYEDLGDLELTRQTILERAEVHIPRDNRLLIESVYHESRRAQLEEDPTWKEYVMQADGSRLGQEKHARDVVLPFDSFYSDWETVQRFRGAERGVRTRLGDDSITIQLPRAVPCHFTADETFDEVNIPLRVLHRKDVSLDEKGQPEGGIVAEPNPSEPTFRLGAELVLRYTPIGWRWD